MAELVQYECSRCGSRLQVLGQAQVWCRCGSPMQPVARDLNPMGMAQPARAPVVEAVGVDLCTPIKKGAQCAEWLATRL